MPDRIAAQRYLRLAEQLAGLLAPPPAGSMAAAIYLAEALGEHEADGTPAILALRAAAVAWESTRALEDEEAGRYEAAEARLAWIDRELALSDVPREGRVDLIIRRMESSLTTAGLTSSIRGLMGCAATLLYDCTALRVVYERQQYFLSPPQAMRVSNVLREMAAAVRYHPATAKYTSHANDPIIPAPAAPTPAPRECLGTGPMFFGVEVEAEYDMDLDTGYADPHDDTPEDGWTETYDGSLDDGIEIVSAPCSIGHWRASAMNRVDALVDGGYRAWDHETCGMHVHISRNAVSPLTWYKVAVLFRDEPGMIEALGRRPANQFCDTPHFPDRRAFAQWVKTGGTLGERYLSINFNNTHTVEFRFFKGTLHAPSILRNIEIARALVLFAERASLAGLTRDGFQSWLRGDEGRNAIGHKQARDITGAFFPAGGPPSEEDHERPSTGFERLAPLSRAEGG